MDTHETVQNGSGASDDASFPYDEVEVIVSDQHLSAGRTLKVRVRHTFRYQVRRWFRLLRGHAEPPDTVEVDNPLEDFYFDSEFEELLDLIVASYGKARVLRIRLLGDCFDPLAVTWRGKLSDPPYEAVAAYKMRQIIRGHKRYFDALANVTRLPNVLLDVFVGNHDQFLCWPAVQRLLARRICGNDADKRERLRFIDQQMDFTEVHRGIEYYHGMNAEPHNTIDPKTTIVYERYGVKLKRPELNKPIGSDMSVDLASRLKLLNAHIGRLREESDIWKYASRFKWGWALYAGFVLCWHLATRQVMVLWDWRSKTGFFALMRLLVEKLRARMAVVISTTQGNPVDAHAVKDMRRKPGIRLFVRGHSHTPRLVQGPDGSYLNVGTWSKISRLEYPTFTYVWKRFRWLEVLWRSFRHFLRTGKIVSIKQVTKVLGFAGAAAAMAVFLLTSFQQHRFHLLGYDLYDLKLPVGIILVFYLLGGIFRIFAVRPYEVDDTRLTFGLVRHGKDGSLCRDLKEYHRETKSIRDYV